METNTANSLMDERETAFNRMANNRVRWRSTVEALCS